MIIICIFSVIVSLVAPILAVILNKRHVAICCLWWALFPILFPYYAKRKGVIKHQWKSWLLVLISPSILYYYLLALIVTMVHSKYHVDIRIPETTNYHNALDLEKATGVEFPDVIPVDSIYYKAWDIMYTRVKFIPKEPLTKAFFQELDNACIKDSCCWQKQDSCYYYLIHPYPPLDRKKGTHGRIVERHNEDDGPHWMMGEWDGHYVSVIVPIKGDTITIEDGWDGR